MSKDLIRRSDAIEALHGEVQITGKENAMAVQHLIGRFTFNIANIPSADVIEPKRGEWQYVYKGQWVFRRCSCCEWTQTYDDSKYMGYRYNFCPNCGADMRGKDDE